MVEGVTPFEQLKNAGNTKLRQAITMVQDKQSLEVCKITIHEAENLYQQAL